MNKSIPSRNTDTQFINIVPINPLISLCDIKVMYAGKNRNKSYFRKDVVEKMANSLPNIPIVGEYLEYQEDYNDHGNEMIIDSNGVKFTKRTIPCGVVPSDTKIAWKNFIDDDGVEREYLMCQGYLWTGRYPETERILSKGNGQSMEIDQGTMKGNWAQLPNEEEEYFIVDEAIFSALCVLGEDIEPCFEGANVTTPTNILYSLDKDDFTIKMSQFMLDLKDALSSKEGGEKMSNVNETVNSELGQDIETPIVENTTTNVEDFAANDVCADCKKPIGECVCDPEKKKNVPQTDNAADEEDSNKTENEETEKPEVETPVEEEEEEDKKTKYNLEEVTEYIELKAKYDALVESNSAMETELFSLRELKTSIDIKEKNEMISKFCMLDEEDLKDVKENIATYSLNEIESKLSVIAVRKKVNFNLDSNLETESNIEKPIVSFNVETIDNTPMWLRAVDNLRKNCN